MADLHFIVNPAAGSGASLPAFARAEAILKEKGVAYTSVRTEYPGHATELGRAAAAAGERVIVAVGGDGTVKELAEGLVHSKAAMGVLPCGTGNDLIRALHIPLEVEAALALLLEKAPIAVDTCLAGEDFFMNVGGFGFDCDVLMEVERFKKTHAGKTAYRMGLFTALTHLKSRKVTLEFDDGRVMTQNCTLVAFGNGTHFGSGMMVCPGADPTDGLMDVCVIDAVGTMTFLSLIGNFIKGAHGKIKQVTHYAARSVKVTSDPSSPLDLDGEVTGTTPITFAVVPASLNMICGR